MLIFAPNPRLKLDNNDKVGEHASGMNILLIGPRGCGKTTIGNLLAARWSRPFVDLDDLTLSRFSESSISAAWQAHGETAWRSAELAALHTALSNDHQIIALGGGTPMIDQARRLIENLRQTRSALAIYLRCSADILSARLRSTPGDRPSLTGSHFIDEVPAVLKAREPTYLEIADIVYDVGLESAEDVAEGVAETVPGNS